MSDPTRVYFGTYTRKGSEGIYVAEFDAATGELSDPRLAAKATNPSFLAVHPNREYLYAVGEMGDFQGRKSGAVSAYHIQPRTSELAFVNTVASGGSGPCFVEVHPSGKAVFAANYMGGSVVSFPVREEGALGELASLMQHAGSGPDPKRQEGPHGHSIRVDPSGKFAIAADLGIDQLLVYRIDETTAALSPHDPPFVTTPPEAGPRHTAWHPGGKWLYAINELSESVSRYAWDPDRGVLQLAETVSTLPPGGETRRASAEIAVHPTGRFVYATNRGQDTIAVFAVDEKTGTLTPRGHVPAGGEQPRHFAIHPSGDWLIVAHQASDTVAVFRIDPATGMPAPTGVARTVLTPVCVRFA